MPVLPPSKANGFFAELATAVEDVNKIVKVVADLVRRVEPMHGPALIL